MAAPMNQWVPPVLPYYWIEYIYFVLVVGIAFLAGWVARSRW